MDFFGFQDVESLQALLHDSRVSAELLYGRDEIRRVQFGQECTGRDGIAHPAQLPRGQRSAKHRKAAEWITALSPDRAEDRAELLAHHYLAAVTYARADGQDTAALSERMQVACANAGDRALELNAFSAAARWYLPASPGSACRRSVLG